MSIRCYIKYSKVVLLLIEKADIVLLFAEINISYTLNSVVDRIKYRTTATGNLM